MMRISRLGVFITFLIAVSLGSGCSFYSRVMARKNLVDGSQAYKDRKLPEAERLFRLAASRDPNGDTVEGRTAQLSLARTLHSEYVGNRQDKSKAQDALTEYQKSLPQSLRDLKETTADYQKNRSSDDAQKRYLNALSSVNSTSSAIASLYDNLGQQDQAQEWQNKVAADASYPITARARAYSSMAARDNNCANDISDTDQTKKTVTKNGAQVFQFVKPANPDDFAKLKQCADDGNKVVDEAMALEDETVKNAGSLDPDKLSDTELDLNLEILKVFESVRSYKASLVGQEMRIAEMDGRTDDHDKLKNDYDAAKQNYLSLSDVVKKLQVVKDKREAAKQEAANAEANANKANSNAK